MRCNTGSQAVVSEADRNLLRSVEACASTVSSTSPLVFDLACQDSDRDSQPDLNPSTDLVDDVGFESDEVLRHDGLVLAGASDDGSERTALLWSPALSADGAPEGSAADGDAAGGHAGLSHSQDGPRPLAAPLEIVASADARAFGGGAVADADVPGDDGSVLALRDARSEGVTREVASGPLAATSGSAATDGGCPFGLSLAPSISRGSSSTSVDMRLCGRDVCGAAVARRVASGVLPVPERLHGERDEGLTHKAVCEDLVVCSHVVRERADGGHVGLSHWQDGPRSLSALV
jgi:hypothetical protein